MIAAYFLFALVMIVAFSLYRNRRFLEAAIISVPVIFCGYFLLSIGIFSFGENMPFTYYRPYRKDEYGFASAMLCLHFLTVIAAFLIVRRFDERPYLANQLQQLKSLGVGPVTALLCLLPVLFIISAVPLSELWYRKSFRLETSTSDWLRFADLLVFVSAVLIPFIRNKVLRNAILWIVTISFLCLGSRTAVAVLMIFAAMNLFVLQKVKAWVSILLLAVACWLLGTILLLRDYNMGGISTVFNVALFGDYAAIADRVLYGFNYNFNLSFVLIAELLRSSIAEAQWFYYSILPLPSAFYDKTEDYDALNRFRTNIPYSGFGYALSYMGPFAYLVFTFASSLAFLIARKLVSLKRDIYEAVLCFGFFVFPFVVLLQYNLRTGARIAYAFLIVYFVVALWRSDVLVLRRRRRSRRVRSRA